MTTPGGITAWLVEDYTVPIVSMNFAFRGGAAQDPEGKSGLANLMSGLLDEGAGSLDSRAFQARPESPTPSSKEAARVTSRNSWPAVPDSVAKVRARAAGSIAQ